LPDHKEFFLEGKMEGDPGKHRPQPNVQQPEAIVPPDETKPDGSGFQMK
jgi:hypothetical protein